MYVLIVKGPRNATLAYHTCDSHADLRELLSVYHALGYAPESLIIQERQDKAA